MLRKRVKKYLISLGEVIRSSIAKAEQSGSHVGSMTLHLPKEMSREEGRVVTEAVKQQGSKSFAQLSVIKVTDEESFFAVDERSPGKGYPLVVRLSKQATGITCCTLKGVRKSNLGVSAYQQRCV